MAVRRNAAETTTLDAIRARGYLLCGIGEVQAGFSRVGAGGERSGLDAEFCTALASAVFGSKDAVKFWPLSANDRFKALQAGDVDVLSRGATWTLSRDTELGARFAGVLFYDGQGFLTRRGNAVASVLELSGASICALPGAMGEQAVAAYLHRTAHALPDRGAGQLGRSGQGLRGRELHGADGRRLAAGAGAQQAEGSRPST